MYEGMRRATPDDIKGIRWPDPKKDKVSKRKPEEIEYANLLAEILDSSEDGVIIDFSKGDPKDDHPLNQMVSARFSRQHAQAAGEYLKRLFQGEGLKDIQYKTRPADYENPYEDWQLIVRYTPQED